jgi:hypothetical protein
VNLSELGVGPGGLLFVSASEPVVVERDSAGMPGFTVSHAVPDFHGRGG